MRYPFDRALPLIVGEPTIGSRCVKYKGMADRSLPTMVGAGPTIGGTSKQIGNRGGMHEVSQTVDLSSKVDALSKKVDQLLALNALPINPPNVQDVHLETQIGQLAAAMSRRDEGKLPSHLIENPKANSYHEQIKAVIKLLETETWKE
ncbi:hypothetical protein M9H77_21946 [Catharanthus roseus]|uniref:Uncharacterized protein n=1 Tax=Catharanthus roseus TaxID=4058 RepID=A0ACC0ANT2_CATRO|nr:hypothetical protein M9H77_21946 [Catharanthus roseus]